MDRFDRLLKYVIRDCQRWIELPENKVSNVDEGFQYFQDYLAGTVQSSLLGLRCEFVELWFHMNFEYSAFYGDKDYSWLAKSSYFKLYYFKIDYALGQVNPGKPFFLTHSAAHTLAELMLLGHWERVVDLGEIILENLATDYFGGGDEMSLHSWFIFELYARYRGKSLDKEGVLYPANLGIYQRVLEAWDSENMDLVRTLVCELCEYHLKNSSEAAAAEFSDLAYFVFPVEILAWLALRRKADLTNPEQYPHPLMDLKINQLPDRDIPLYSDELLGRVILKFKQEYPVARLSIIK